MVLLAQFPFSNEYWILQDFGDVSRVHGCNDSGSYSFVTDVANVVCLQLPIYAVVTLGCYGLGAVGYGLMVFPTCPHEAELLQKVWASL